MKPIGENLRYSFVAPGMPSKLIPAGIFGFPKVVLGLPGNLTKDDFSTGLQIPTVCHRCGQNALRDWRVRAVSSLASVWPGFSQHCLCKFPICSFMFKYLTCSLMWTATWCWSCLYFLLFFPSNFFYASSASQMQYNDSNIRMIWCTYLLCGPHKDSIIYQVKLIKYYFSLFKLFIF